MKKVKSIYTGLIAAVLLASVSTSASAWMYAADGWTHRSAEEQRIHLEHWAPYNNGIEYFIYCTIGQQCAGSKWR